MRSKLDSSTIDGYLPLRYNQVHISRVNLVLKLQGKLKAGFIWVFKWKSKLIPPLKVLSKEYLQILSCHNPHYFTSSPSSTIPLVSSLSFPSILTLNSLDSFCAFARYSAALSALASAFFRSSVSSKVVYCNFSNSEECILLLLVGYCCCSLVEGAGTCCRCPSCSFLLDCVADCESVLMIQILIFDGEDDEADDGCCGGGGLSWWRRWFLILVVLGEWMNEGGRCVVFNCIFSCKSWCIVGGCWQFNSCSLCKAFSAKFASLIVASCRCFSASLSCRTKKPEERSAARWSVAGDDFLCLFLIAEEGYRTVEIYVWEKWVMSRCSEDKRWR